MKGFIVVQTISGRETSLNLDQVIGFRDIGIHVECETSSHQSFVIVEPFADLVARLPRGGWLRSADVLVNHDHLVAIQSRKEGGTWLYLTKRWLDVQYLEESYESLKDKLEEAL